MTVHHKRCERCKGSGLSLGAGDRYSVLPVKLCSKCNTTYDPLAEHVCDPCLVLPWNGLAEGEIVSFIPTIVKGELLQTARMFPEGKLWAWALTWGRWGVGVMNMAPPGPKRTLPDDEEAWAVVKAAAKSKCMIERCDYYDKEKGIGGTCPVCQARRLVKKEKERIACQ